MKKLLIATILLFTAMTVNAQSASQAITCKGVTKAGTSCIRKASTDGYCFQHSPSAARCGAKTKDNGACMRIVKTVGMHCKQHTAAKQ